MVVRATQTAATRYAEIVLAKHRDRILSRCIGHELDLSAGAFRWEVEPTVGDDGEWYDATSGPPEARYSQGMVRLLTPLLTEGTFALIEHPMLLRERPSYGIRTLFNSTERGLDAILVAEPSAATETTRLAASIVGGAYYFVGIVTRGPDDFPADGTDVSEEQVRKWVHETTHFLFRGPSYGSFLLWEREEEA